MRNIKALGMLFVALLLSVAAAVYAAGWMSQQQGIASNKVVVAVVDVELGTRIQPTMLSTIDWPSGSVPAGAFADVKAVQERVAKVSVLKGEAILEGKLAPPGTKGGLSAVITEGKRAMTVRVNDVIGVAGFALPGNYVDVMVNAQQERIKNEEGKQISKTVLEHVLVLAVAQEAGRDDTKPKVVSAVTLELSPADSEKLDLARSVGSLSLVLRNQIDKLSVATTGITKQQLFDLPEPAPVQAVQTVQLAQAVHTVRAVRKVAYRPQPVQAARDCVEIIQNGSRGVDCFDSSKN